MSDRKRHAFVLLLVAGLLAGSVVALFTAKTELGLDLRGGVQLIYQAQPSPQTPKITQTALNRAVTIMQSRVNGLGVSSPRSRPRGATRSRSACRRAQRHAGRAGGRDDVEAVLL